MILPKQLQAAAAKAEPLNDSVQLLRLGGGAVGGLIRDYDVSVDVGVDHVTVQGAPHSSLDSHEAVLLRVLKDAGAIDVAALPRALAVGLEPADVLAPPEPPLPENVPPCIQALLAAAPQQYEARGVGDILHLEVHDLLPSPAGPVTHPRGPPLVLLPRRVHKDHVELGAKGARGELRGPEVALHVHGRGSALHHQLVFAID
mmetsp:Transcript_63417/g.200571  ORF Transcript_63417/g.200571 Transcript_63417/m.200571 type:complete len:202 (-) Transcript_63417:215-820(-)